jgi:hypothetical protein
MENEAAMRDIRLGAVRILVDDHGVVVGFTAPWSASAGALFLTIEKLTSDCSRKTRGRLLSKWRWCNVAMVQRLRQSKRRSANQRRLASNTARPPPQTASRLKTIKLWLRGTCWAGQEDHRVKGSPGITTTASCSARSGARLATGGEWKLLRYAGSETRPRRYQGKVADRSLRSMPQPAEDITMLTRRGFVAQQACPASFMQRSSMRTLKHRGCLRTASATAQDFFTAIPNSRN